MKKILFIEVLTIFIFNSFVLGYSSEFEYMLNALNIEKQNVNGNYINEEIYNKYNLLVYGSPKIINKNQRWKETTNGKWLEKGIVGEYRILRRKLFWERSS